MDLSDENLGRQADEVEALAAIYGDDWRVEDEHSRTYSIQIELEGTQHLKIQLQVTLPLDYPAQSPPHYQLNAPWLRGVDRMDLSNTLEDCFCKNLGENLVYMWVEKIRDFLARKAKLGEVEEQVKNLTVEDNEIQLDGADMSDEKLKTSTHAQKSSIIASPTTGNQDIEMPPIYHGDTITDRKSTFQGHLAPVFYKEQVNMVLEKLFENKKIANASHNCFAYRIDKGNGISIQNCEDDGETHAGQRMLHLLQIMEANNVMIIVTRWYGGILLGPDRFKHINNCARMVLTQEGYAVSKTDKKDASKGKRS